MASARNSPGPTALVLHAVNDQVLRGSVTHLPAQRQTPTCADMSSCSCLCLVLVLMPLVVQRQLERGAEGVRQPEGFADVVAVVAHHEAQAGRQHER